jgi:protein-disulfide isomerase
MLDVITANPEHLALEDLVGHATALRLDASRFRSDLALHTFREAVELDQDHMAAMGIDAVPSAIVNGKRVHGALPVDAFAGAVEAVLGMAAAPPRAVTRQDRVEGSRPGDPPGPSMRSIQ